MECLELAALLEEVRAAPSAARQLRRRSRGGGGGSGDGGGGGGGGTGRRVRRGLQLLVDEERDAAGVLAQLVDDRRLLLRERVGGAKPRLGRARHLKPRRLRLDPRLHVRPRERVLRRLRDQVVGVRLALVEPLAQPTLATAVEQSGAIEALEAAHLRPRGA